MARSGWRLGKIDRTLPLAKSLRALSLSQFEQGETSEATKGEDGRCAIRQPTATPAEAGAQLER